MNTPATILGYAVLYTQPDFARAPRQSGARGHEMFQGGENRTAYIHGRRALSALPRNYVFITRAEADAFHEFFCRRAGRWEPFFVPGWHGELAPKENWLGGSATLTLHYCNYSAAYRPEDTRQLGQWIYALDANGEMHITRVLSVQTDGSSYDRLTVETAPSRTLQAGNYHVGFMYFVRFSSDSLLMQWSGPNYAECEAPMTEIIQESAPAD